MRDPAAVDGTEAEQRKAFSAAYAALENRIKMFVALPIGQLDPLKIKQKANQIGRLSDPNRSCRDLRR